MKQFTELSLPISTPFVHFYLTTYRGWLEANGHKPSAKLTKEQVKAMQQATWRIKDAGNGEQTAWWCWAMARLRKEAGLPAESVRPKR